jgi:hypothetical protein
VIVGGAATAENMSASSFNDRLQTLLMDAEKFTPGSQQRTESLEQIRSMLLDKK